MYIAGSSSSLTVRSSSFVSCNANVYQLYRGGGAFFASQIKESFTFESRFIQCTTTNAGGAIFCWSISTGFCICDSLFHGNTASYHGGAIREYTCSKSSTVHLKYLFLTNNKGGDGYGNVLSVYPEISDCPFLHSFSTSLTNSISIYNDTLTAYCLLADWLPLGTLSYVNTWQQRQQCERLTICKAIYGQWPTACN